MSNSHYIYHNYNNYYYKVMYLHKVNWCKAKKGVKMPANLVGTTFYAITPSEY